MIVFFSRSPVLIVTEQIFSSFYGEGRIRRETFRSSLVLFRRVRNVVVANDAGYDTVALAVGEFSRRPFCVLFPLRFARSARMYREQNPHVPVVILEGRYPENENPSGFAIGGNASDYFIFKTDIERDFYRAGLAAAAIDNGRGGEIVVFVDSNIQDYVSAAFLQGIDDFVMSLPSPHVDFLEQQNVEIPVPHTNFYTSFSRFNNRPDISCVVIAGIGHEFLENRRNTPVIIFSWLDPVLLPEDVSVIVNDSPWVSVVQAVRLVRSETRSGVMASEFQFIDRGIFNRETLHKIQRLW